MPRGSLSARGGRTARQRIDSRVIKITKNFFGEQVRPYGIDGYLARCCMCHRPVPRSPCLKFIRGATLAEGMRNHDFKLVTKRPSTMNNLNLKRLRVAVAIGVAAPRGTTAGLIDATRNPFKRMNWGLAAMSAVESLSPTETSNGRIEGSRRAADARFSSAGIRESADRYDDLALGAFVFQQARRIRATGRSRSGAARRARLCSRPAARLVEFADLGGCRLQT